MKQDYAKKDNEIRPMATFVKRTMENIYTTEEYLEDIGYISIRNETLPDHLLESFKDTVCTPESDKRVGDSIWREIRKPVGRID